MKIRVRATKKKLNTKYLHLYNSIIDLFIYNGRRAVERAV